MRGFDRGESRDSGHITPIDDCANVFVHKSDMVDFDKIQYEAGDIVEYSLFKCEFFPNRPHVKGLLKALNVRKSQTQYERKTGVFQLWKHEGAYGFIRDVTRFSLRLNKIIIENEQAKK